MAADIRRSIAALPATPGVYRFRDARGRALYIGRATALRHRVGSYWSELGDRSHLARMVAQVVAVEAVACASVHEAAWLERNLLERSKPRFNRTRGGQEVPVYIHLDPRPGRPRLTLVHVQDEPRGGRLFGPYLGGSQVRLALAAMQRILPLSYSGASITGAERDMGRKLGVTAVDREWLVDAIAAILSQNADAVTRAQAALTDLRDRSASSLAFERAAVIQAEADALAWVTSPQRATVDGDEDHDAVGFAGGILVQFTIRSGRICVWSQRPASAATASRRVATTPTAWLEFAQRTADLAAAIAQPV